VRKYTGEPYFNHCEEVAQILLEHGGDTVEICTGYLHDTVEDTDMTFPQLTDQFGSVISNTVRMVTDVAIAPVKANKKLGVVAVKGDGNREQRCAINLKHFMESADQHGMRVKLADTKSNSRDILKHDRDFARVYLPEKAKLMRVIPREIAPKLWDENMIILLRAFKDLGMKRELKALDSFQWLL
jgi:(p)ppGpp synthase/HD superfamily hydrolase